MHEESAQMDQGMGLMGPGVALRKLLAGAGAARVGMRRMFRGTGDSAVGSFCAVYSVPRQLAAPQWHLTMSGCSVTCSSTRML